jgi:hypothetical protein
MHRKNLIQAMGYSLLDITLREVPWYPNFANIKKEEIV